MPGQRKCAFRRQHVADLGPGRLHEFVLVLPHHFGAPAGGEAVARLQAQIIQPVLADLLPSTVWRLAGYSP